MRWQVVGNSVTLKGVEKLLNGLEVEERCKVFYRHRGSIQSNKYHISIIINYFKYMFQLHKMPKFSAAHHEPADYQDRVESPNTAMIVYLIIQTKHIFINRF